jgi:hypothetical protein
MKKLFQGIERSSLRCMMPPVRLGAYLFLFCALFSPAPAQDQGLPVGGNWTVYRAEDKMTAAQKARFELLADNGGGDDRAKITLFCTNGKLSLADFRPNMRIAPPNRASFWGKPQMNVMVRVDSSHSRHNWNWVNGHFLAMDEDTTRQMIGSQIFKVQFQTPQGPQIAEFSPGGIDLAEVKKSCGLKPEKP